MPAIAVDVGGALVVILSVKVGTPVMQTEDDCRGFVEHRDPVVPVTVVAGFFGEEDPVGPYAVGMWSAGYSDGGDHHFGTDQAHMRRQTFHFLLTANRLVGYHGPGYYDITVWVQDVGLQGGIDTKTVNTYIAAPRQGTAKVKCSVVTETAWQFVAGAVADAAYDLLLERFCPACAKVIPGQQGLAGESDQYGTLRTHHVMTLVAGMAAGAEFVDDADLLPNAGMGQRSARCGFRRRRARSVARKVRDAITAARRCGANGPILLGADSAYCSASIITVDASSPWS